MIETLNIGICDDEPVQVEMINNLLIKNYSHLDMNILKAYSGQELINYGLQKTLDIVFLDMEMIPLNGIETGKELLKQNKDIIIVYITGFKDYSLHAYQVKPLDYIIKPITESRLNKLMEDIILRFRQIMALYEKTNTFTVNTKGSLIKMAYRDIICFEKSLRQVKLHSTQGQYTFYSSFKNLKDMLDMEQFIQCHQSFIVNKKFILVFKNNQLLIRDNQMVIPVSRKYKAKVTEALKDNIF